MERVAAAEPLGLAQWLFDPKNPLTARVFVNRMWQSISDRGWWRHPRISASRARCPRIRNCWTGWRSSSSSPAGTSSSCTGRSSCRRTYRQRSDATDELIEFDPRNALLTRGPRYRMPAEMVRDNALAASGLLVKTIGGPSVYPYQPDSVWNQATPATAIRRPSRCRPTICTAAASYTFIKRNRADPELQLFDFPDRNASTVRRQISNTPLQALELLNDPQFVEAYRALATHALRSATDVDAQLTLLFRLATAPVAAGGGARHPAGVLPGRSAALRRGPGRRRRNCSRTGVTPLDPRHRAGAARGAHLGAALVMNSPDAYSIR